MEPAHNQPAEQQSPTEHLPPVLKVVPLPAPRPVQAFEPLEIAVEGHDGCGKSPVIASVRADLEARGYKVKVCAPFSEVNEARFVNALRERAIDPASLDEKAKVELFLNEKLDVFHLCTSASLEKQLEGFNLLKDAVAKAKREAVNEGCDVLLFDRHWITVHSMLQPGVPFEWKPIRTFFIEAPPEKTASCKRLEGIQEKVAYVRSLEEIERWYRIYNEIRDRYPHKLLGTATVSTREQPLGPISDQARDAILDLLDNRWAQNVRAVTGVIGSGKSTVMQRLAARGFFTVSADQLARIVVEPGQPGLEQIVQRFGPTVLAADKSLDRAKLRALVFGDPQAVADLNKIVHPLVAAEAKKRFLEAGKSMKGPFFYEVPLLFEAGLYKRVPFQELIVVSRPEDVSTSQAAARDGGTADGTKKILSHQWPNSEKVRHADTVLPNTGTKDDLYAVVDSYLAKI